MSVPDQAAPSASPKPPIIRSPDSNGGTVWKLPVIHEDEFLLVLNKAPNLAIDEGVGRPGNRCLLPRLHRNIRDGAAWARSRNLNFLAPVNRLDPEISGVLILAKTKEVHGALADQLGAQKPIRQYLALVKGKPSVEPQRIEKKISVSPENPDRAFVDPEGGKKAISEIWLVEAFRLFSLVGVRAWTERPQQVRLHLGAVGHGPVGDPCHGVRPLMLSSIKPGFRARNDRPENPLMGRPAVHASAMTVQHPETGIELTLQAPLAKDLAVALKYLRQFSALS